MADTKGRPVDGPPANDVPRTCVACGRYHGPAAAMRCLEGEVRRLRQQLVDFPRIAAELRRYRSEVNRAYRLGATGAGLDILDALIKGEGT